MDPGAPRARSTCSRAATCCSSGAWCPRRDPGPAAARLPGPRHHPAARPRGRQQPHQDGVHGPAAPARGRGRAGEARRLPVRRGPGGVGWRGPRMFVQPSLLEGLPLTLLEAAAYELPPSSPVTSRRTSRCSTRTGRGTAWSRAVTRRPWPVPWPGCWATGRASGPVPWRSVTASSAPTAGRTRPTPPNVSTAGSWTHVGRDLSTADGNRRRVVSIRKCNYSTLRRLGFRRRKGPC